MSTPTLHGDTQRTQGYDRLAPINAQQDSADAIAVALLAVWVNVRTQILQMSPSIVPTNSPEELGLIRRLLKKYNGFSPSEFAEAIRKAAITKMGELSRKEVLFPTLYAADFEAQLDEMGIEKVKQRDKEKALQLPANTGGNVFWGEPSEALAREWPNIVRNTKSIRETLNRNYLRDRFWYGGSKEQQAAAKQMLIQMVYDMTAAGFCTIDDLKKEAVGVFRSEFARAFPPHLDLVEHLACPLDFLQVEECKKRLSRRIADVSEFPDIDDCKYSATFDLYFKFKEAGK